MDGKNRYSEGIIGDQKDLTDRGADPRILALVRFIARRAADADYAELLKASEDDERKLTDNEDND